MATSSSSRALTNVIKKLDNLMPLASPTAQQQTRHLYKSYSRLAPTPSKPNSATASNVSVEDELARLRLPKAVQATYLAPLKRPSPGGAQKSASLHLRSYSVRNLEVFADFALRAAYYLGLSATGPRPLPRKIQRWTLPRSNFVHKKSQETFERITMQRLIEIQDGHTEVVAIWLAFLRKHQYYGVGMKAHVYDHTGLETAGFLDKAAEQFVILERGDKLGIPGQLDATLVTSDSLFKKPFKDSWGAAATHGALPISGQNDTGLPLSSIKEALGNDESEIQSKQRRG